MRQGDGFTLVELLVVIGVVGVLMGALVAVLNPIQFFKQGRDSRRLSDLTTIQAALEQYYAQNGNYPQPADLPAVGDPFTDGSVTYLKSMPGDPSTGSSYYYCVDANPASHYDICATMEDTADLPDDCGSAAYGCSGDCCLTNPF